MINNDLLVQSRFVQTVCNDKEAYIWHSLFGKPKCVSLDTLQLIDFFREPKSISSLTEEYDFEVGVEDAIQLLMDDYFLIQQGFDERAYLEEITQEREAGIGDGELVRRLDLKLTEECNFRCRYCIHFESFGISDRANTSARFMSFELAKRAVDKYASLMKKHDKRTAQISFSGGEVLLAWDVLEQIVLYYRKAYQSGLPCQFSIMTNASLVTNDIARKLKKYGISVASSIDGLKQANDLVRITKKGDGTFDAIVAGLDRLKRQGIPVDVCVTLTDANFPYIDERMIDWAVEHGSIEIGITPDVINALNVSGEEIVARMLRLRAYGKTKGIEVVGGWYRAFYHLSVSALDKLCGYCGPVCGDTISVSPSGLLFACCYSTDSIGDISQWEHLFDKNGGYQKMVSGHVAGRQPGCFNCEIEGQCAGECDITRKCAAVFESAKIRQMCELSRRMTYEMLFEKLKEGDSVTSI